MQLGLRYTNVVFGVNTLIICIAVYLQLLHHYCFYGKWKRNLKTGRLVGTEQNGIFSSTLLKTERYNWSIAESGVKHNNPKI